MITERSQVGDVVVNVLDGEGEDLDTHPADVRSGDFSDEGRKLVSVLVHLLNSQCAWKKNSKLNFFETIIQN